MGNIINNRDDNSSNSGAMVGYPPSIRGDLITQFKVPMKDLPKAIQDIIKMSSLYQSTATKSPGRDDLTKPEPTKPEPTKPEPTKPEQMDEEMMC